MTQVVVAVHVRGGIVAEVRAFTEEEPAKAWERELAGPAEYNLPLNADFEPDWSESDGAFAIERVDVEGLEEPEPDYGAQECRG